MFRAFTSERCQLHRPPAGAPERPERLEAVRQGVVDAGWDLEDVNEGRYREEEVREAIHASHSAAYVERFERAVRRGDGLIDSADNPLSPGTFAGSLAAVEVALAATDAVGSGELRQSFAAVRPPGHHAERDEAMGFCYFANAAIAAERLLGRHDLEKVAVVDFDVHHGNGTQHLFEERADVFFASLHQHPFYPGTGLASEQGRGEGLGATLNLPLPAGLSSAEFESVIDERLLPALREFAPQAIVVSAGFDGWVDDPLGGWRVETESYRWVGERLVAAAEASSKGRLVALLEGGYSLEGLRHATAAFLSGVARRPPV